MTYTATYTKSLQFKRMLKSPPTPAEGGGAREGLQVREPCASSSQHEPAGNRRFHCSMLLEHMHHWSRNLLRFFVAARTCRQQTRPLLHAARTHASVEPQATATYEPLWRWLTMSRSCSLRPSPSRKQGWAPKVCPWEAGGSFWSRLRLEKAVAGPGLRGQEDRDK